MKKVLLERLSGRKHSILMDAVENFIKEENLVTSASAQKAIGLKVSTATLRNELNALEAMGLLKQLHTSSGRVPTTQAYKYYVSFLMAEMNFDADALMEVRQKIEKKTSAVCDIVSSIANVVSQATSYPTVVLMNGFNNLIVESIKIVPLIENEMIVLMKTSLGIVKKEISLSATEEECQKAAAFVEKVFAGKSVGEMFSHATELARQTAQEVTGFMQIVNQLVAGLQQFAQETETHIKNQSVSNILKAQDLDGSKKVQSALEKKASIKNIMGGESHEVEFVFGDEEKAIDGCALITAPIIIGGQEIAKVGVLGPERLEYGKVANALKVISSELSHLKKGEEENEKK